MKGQVIENNPWIGVDVKMELKLKKIKLCIQIPEVYWCI